LPRKEVGDCEGELIGARLVGGADDGLIVEGEADDGLIVEGGADDGLIVEGLKDG